MRSNSVHSCCAALNLGQVGYISRKLKFAVGPRAKGNAVFVPKAEKAFKSNTGKRSRHSLELPQISHPEYKPNPVAILR